MTDIVVIVAVMAQRISYSACFRFQPQLSHHMYEGASLRNSRVREPSSKIHCTAYASRIHFCLFRFIRHQICKLISMNAVRAPVPSHYLVQPCGGMQSRFSPPPQRTGVQQTKAKIRAHCKQ